jgi:hypothetical protein
MQLDFKKAPLFNGHMLSGSSPILLWRLLQDNHFAISPRFIPRFLIALLLTILNWPIALLEKLLFRKRIKQTKVQSPVFILGYPRSGTTYLYYLLSRDPRFSFLKTYEAMAPHVIFLFGKIMQAIARLALPKSRPMDNLQMGADLPKEAEFAMANLGLASLAHGYYFPTNFQSYFERYVLFEKEKHKKIWQSNFDFLCKKLTLLNKGKRLLLKSPFDTARIDAILELYPNAKFVYLHRDPVAVYASNEKLFASILPAISLQEIEVEQIHPIIVRSYKQTIGAYQDQKASIPAGNLLEISYEDFVQHQEKTLQNIYEALDLGDFEKALPHLKKEMRQYENYQKNRYKMDAEKVEWVKREMGAGF